MQNPVVVVSVPYPGASPESVEREVIDRIEEGHRRDQRRRQDPVELARRLRRHHHVLPVREGPAGGDAGDPRQDLRDPQRAAAGDGGADPDAVQSGRPADHVAGAVVEADGRARADAARRSRHHPPAARHSRRRRGRSGRRRRARADGGAAAARPAGGRPQRRAGGAGAPGAEPGGAGRAPQRPVRRADDPPARPAREAGRLRPAADRAVAGAASSASATSPTPATAPRSRAPPRSSTARRRSASTSRRPRASAPRRSRRRSASRSRRSRPALPEGVAFRVVRDAGTRVAASVAQRPGSAGRRRGADRAGGLPLPELLALDGHHRPGAAGVGAGLVRRGARLRLHAEHDVAARAVARDRHPDRRCDRGAREHRAPRGDGEGPLHRGARGHQRDRAGGGGHDLLDRRGVRADRLHGRDRRAVVRAVRADHRLLGAGLAVRVVLARSDAVGLLAGSARAAGAAVLHHPLARPVQRLVRPPGRPLQAGDRLGARPPLDDGVPRGRDASSARWRCRRWASSAASSSR